MVRFPKPRFHRPRFNKRRTIIVTLAALALAGALVVFLITRPLPVLTVATWPGAYGRAQATALLRPYAAENRVDVRLALWDGELKQLSNGDVLDFELPRAMEACRAGLLETLDTSDMPAGVDGTPAARDFVPGALGPCWVGSAVYSQAIAFAPDAFAVKAPASLRDFFDGAAFPGPRGLRDGAKYNLEMALLADGVKPEAVYRILGTNAGVARALRKLASLGAVVWWNAAGQPANLLGGGAVKLSTILNGDIFDAAQKPGAPGVIWDRQLSELDVFASPKGNGKRVQGIDFIRYATGSSPLAAMAGWVPYGPARRSSLAQVGKNPELGMDMRGFLPTDPANFQSAFAVDDGWWLDNATRIAPLWKAWRASH